MPVPVPNGLLPGRGPAGRGAGRGASGVGPAAAPRSEGGTNTSASLVLTGLYSVALGVPLAVLGEAAGPYDDPKVWALLILAAATGFLWLVHAWNRTGSAAPACDKRARILRLIILSCVSWWAIITATSIAPLQSLLGSFGRGIGLLTMTSAALMFFLVQSECRTPGAVRSIVDIALLGSVRSACWRSVKPEGGIRCRSRGIPRWPR